jgi:CheY-like chemotaxis protein
VDDSQEELELRKEFLEMHGYTVFTAADGNDGIELLRREHVDAVLLDFQMPGLDGGETARRMRKLRPKARIILFSGHLEPIPATHAAIFDAVLWKGEPLRLLLNLLEQITPRDAQPQRRVKRAATSDTDRLSRTSKARRSA